MWFYYNLNGIHIGLLKKDVTFIKWNIHFLLSWSLWSYWYSWMICCGCHSRLSEYLDTRCKKEWFDLSTKSLHMTLIVIFLPFEICSYVLRSVDYQGIQSKRNLTINSRWRFEGEWKNQSIFPVSNIVEWTDKGPSWLFIIFWRVSNDICDMSASFRWNDIFCLALVKIMYWRWFSFRKPRS